jgi:hypothetical protein
VILVRGHNLSPERPFPHKLDFRFALIEPACWQACPCPLHRAVTSGTGVDILNLMPAVSEYAMMVPSGTGQMPIRRFIKVEMGSAEINRLNVAYARALRMLDLVDRDDPVTDIVAEKVVEVGSSGAMDPREIADRVALYFRKTRHREDGGE